MANLDFNVGMSSEACDDWKKNVLECTAPINVSQYCINLFEGLAREFVLISVIKKKYHQLSILTE